MFLNTFKRFRDLLIIVLGIVGLFWFFYDLPNLEPLSIARLELTREEAVAKGDSILQAWNLLPTQGSKEADISSFSNLIRSVQQKEGTRSFIENAQSEDNKAFPFYFWKVREVPESNRFNPALAQAYSLSLKGELFGIDTPSEVLKASNPFNKELIKKVFGIGSSGYNETLVDSLIAELIEFQNSGNQARTYFNIQKIVNELGIQRSASARSVVNERYVWDMARFYLNESMWNAFDFEADSLEYVEEGGLRYARLFWKTDTNIIGQQPTLITEILPAGILKKMEATIDVGAVSKKKDFQIKETLFLALILFFGLWVLTVFYLRIKAGAIDTKPAFIIAILAGLLLPVYLALNIWPSISVSNNDFDTAMLFDQLFVLGIVGAISAIGFFVLTAVSDSICRQYWPEKLKSWDLLRRGLFNNKPVGWSLVYALCIGASLAGLWVLLIRLLPDLFFEGWATFISHDFVFSSVANLVYNLLISLLVIIIVYMIFSNQVIALTQKKWLIPIISAIIFGLVLDEVLRIDLTDSTQTFILNALLGAFFGLLYLRYDFVTILLGFFVFFGFVTTKNGWIIDQSPDANSFYLFITLLTVFTASGILFIKRGSERKELPDYVPEYIEVQAKEQRVQQELDIAQKVQKTFLPTQMKSLPGIDMAGCCIPAQETGGDYYDMISLGENRTALAIGDVSGKGIQAAFYMTFVKGVLHSLSPLILSPLELLNQLNRLFNENATRGTFISMIYGVLEADKRIFTFARAGHNPMLLMKADGTSQWLQTKGIGIGVAKGQSFIRGTIESELKLEEGDVLVLYTDGITEMLNISNQFYGEEGLEELVRKVRKKNSSTILDIIIQDVTEFKGVAKQHDDMTLVVIKADTSANQ